MINRKTRTVFVALLALLAGSAARAEDVKPFRPPAVPLITHNPYLSIWSESDTLNGDVTRHWTHHPHSLMSLIKIDGKNYRLMSSEPKDVPAFPQKSVVVWPTRSIYDFDDGHVHVTMTFLSPALPNDLDALALPLSYLTWQVKSVDGVAHAVSLFDSTGSDLTVFDTKQKVTWARETTGPLTALHTGSEDQAYLARMGDDTRIDWGYAYTAASTEQSKSAIGPVGALLGAFVENGILPAQDDARQPRPAKDQQPAMAFTFDLGKVEATTVERRVIVAYDEIYSIKYFGQRLRPYWRRNGASATDMLQGADRDYSKLLSRCEAFDKDLMADMTRVGGEKYAQIAALSYRETLCGCGLVADAKGQPFMFTKENTSNGDIATVDVIFPMDPIFIFLSPTLAKATLVSVLDYAASAHWKFPNAPHDLGTYPVIMGRDDGGEGMPVEESGNMLILCDAIARAEGNPDFVNKWWPQLTQWAKYLEQYGLDPENQLCTDDFMGHLAHNANLSVKAILGLACYGDLCHLRGDEVNAKKYLDLAKADAAHWVKAAGEGEGDQKHFRLAFDKPNTWSQKYNLVWDKLLGLNIFPPSVAATEIAYYKTKAQKYGVPLDSRTKLTKTDWSIWSATMAESPADFDAMVSPMWDYLNQTTVRDPLADSFETNKLNVGGMHARPVMGGAFIPMLADPVIWKKWASADKQKVGPWAELPEPPVVKEVVASSQFKPQVWRFTTTKPVEGWEKPGFDVSQWDQGNGGFGTNGTPGAVIGSVWKTDDIWIRREFVMPEGEFANLQFSVYHDEDIEIYINGELAGTAADFENSYQPLEIRRAAKDLLKPGTKITLAAHCHQTKGGQGVDVGLVDVIEKK